MSPLPNAMRDRWANRNEPKPGSGTIYWHMLMGKYPEAQTLAKDAQTKLATFDGFHFTPQKWLHMTTLIAGDASGRSVHDMREMIAQARSRLKHVKPITVTLGKILYHPEAIMLRAMPDDALIPVLEAAKEATRANLGYDGAINGSLPKWTPHMTIAYSTRSQPAEPIIRQLGMSAGEQRVQIEALSLVIQWGPERLWDWEVVGSARLGIDDE